MKKYRFFKKTLSYAKVVLFVCAIFAVERFCHRQTRGFRLSKITSNLVPNPKWDVSPLSIEQQNQVADLLDQPYTFLGDGGQSYAFLSEDKTTVLKFFKLHHMQAPALIAKMKLLGPLETYRKNFVEKRDRKLHRTFASCILAFDHLKEETGLLYVHLNKTNTWNKSVTIYDKLGIAHKVNLDTTEFVLQKRADLFLDRLKKEIRQGHQHMVKKDIEALLQFLAVRCQKGIRDKDSGLKRNFGISEGKVIEIDIGSFKKDELLKQREKMEEEMRSKSKRLFQCLQWHAPDLLPYYEETLKALCQEHS